MPTQPLPSSPRGGAGPWPVWLIVGVCFLALLVLAAAFYVEENWRGARAWAACQRDLQARGEATAWSAVIPPPVPDAQNLAMAPFFVRELNYGPDPKTGAYTFRRIDKSPSGFGPAPYGNDRPKGFQRAGWLTASRTANLAACQLYFRQQPGFPHPDQPQAPAEDILLALSRYSPALDEIAQAAAVRPFTRFPVDWATDFPASLSLPHYNLEQQIVSALSLRALILPGAGRAGDALRDLELCLRFSRDMGADGSSLVGHLVQITCLGLTLSPVWEGLADRRWSAAELARLQAGLQSFDLPAGYRLAFRSARADSIRIIDYLNVHRDPTVFLPMNFGGGTPTFRAHPFAWLAIGAVPRGWFDLSKDIVARFEQTYCVEAVAAEAHRFLPDKLAAGERVLAAMPDTPITHVARLMLPGMSSIALRSARLQTGLDHAAVACALERFYLDRQAYPARLDELVPAYLQHLPPDVIDGAPLRYSLTPDGRYRLYSVGWDGRDNGGKVVFDSPGHLAETAGNWVWQYTSLLPPAASAPAAK